MKSIEYITLIDVDAFVRTLSTRLAKPTVADTCSRAVPSAQEAGARIRRFSKPDSEISTEKFLDLAKK